MAFRVIRNGDHVGVVWSGPGDPPAATTGCLGYAIDKRAAGDTSNGVPLQNHTGFTVQQGLTLQSSADCPVQRFSWWDYSSGPAGAASQYRMRPRAGQPGALTDVLNQTSDWSPPVQVSADCGDGISCYFNKGIVSAEWVLHSLTAGQPAGAKPNLASLTTDIKTIGNPVRDSLSGQAREMLVELLTATAQNGGSIYAALYELNDPELIACITALGTRANVVLANGAFKSNTAPNNDENAAVRAQLRGKINLFDRIVPLGHFAHNKFVVFCDSTGAPQQVWTGSLNWTLTGLCTQANNVVYIDSADAAKIYLQQWQLLHQAGSSFPPSLAASNSQLKQCQVGNSKVTVCFAPTQHQEDLNYARQLINAAQQGILFLMFEPGAFEADPTKWTLLQSILNRHQSSNNPYYNAGLYIRGVVNQEIQNLTEDPTQLPAHLDPTTQPGAAVYTGGVGQPDLLSTEVQVPASIRSQTGNWSPELMNQGVKIHSKVIIIDPFGAHPVLITGSHNLGYKASTMNDDNLIIIEGNAALAQAYALNAYQIYQQYRANAAAGSVTNFGVLQPTDSWQTMYYSDPHLEDMEFWAE